MFHYTIRRAHRWLGLFIGIQFLAWTISGLYFSWSNMDEVHGDLDKMHPVLLDAKLSFASPDFALDSLRKSVGFDSLSEIKLVQVLGRPCWQIGYFPRGHEHHHKKYALADAVSGMLRPPLNQEEAVQIAMNSYSGKGSVRSVAYLTDTDLHHEYREQPLPAFAITFDDERQSTAYVAAELGTFQKIRNQPWRRFDWLWMLHTMDYQSRDNISNWVLRVFSILGLVTVLSGLILFWVSRKTKTNR